MVAIRRKRNYDVHEAIDTAEASSGKRSRGMNDATGNSDDSPATREKRCRVSAFPVAFAAGKEIVKEHAQSWDP